RFAFVSRIWPSDANFLLVRFDDAQRIMRHCAEHRVLLRHVGGDLHDCIRITIGAPEENDTLLDALGKYEDENRG
ncbi:MAG: hypothetical protein P8Y01_06345, partial [Woeseiaceae bacterium]